VLPLPFGTKIYIQYFPSDLMHKHVRRLKVVLIVMVVALFFLLISKSTLVRNSFSDPAALRSFVFGFGILAPLAIIFLQMFLAAVPIIPSEITTIAAGFIFGPILGIAYSIIGAFLGSYLVFLAARNYGKRMVELFFTKKDVVHFNLFFKQRGLWALFVARVAPFFPNDVISFAAGLTSMKSWQFNIVSTFGYMVEVVLLASFGAELSHGRVSVPVLIIGIFIVLLLLISLFKHTIRKLLIKDLFLLEKEGKNAERFIEKEFRKI